MTLSHDPTAELLGEQGLVTQAQAGDRWAFADLVRLHRAGVVNVVYRMCGDAALAEDAAQECFIRAWSHLHRFRSAPGADHAFRNWLYRIATNCALNQLRQDRSGPVLQAQAAELPLADTRPGPEGRVEEGERARVVQHAVLALPEASRVVLILREYEELSYQEIAHVLDIPIGTVMSRLNYARCRLRERLAGYMEGTYDTH